MSTYDRPFYHARSNVASTAYTKSTAIPKERKVTFASEWHFYPLGVAVVIERFEAFLADNHLTASCEWDEQTHSFRLCCRAEDSPQVSARFYEAIHGVIKQELKKGFKGKGSPYPDGDDDDDDDDESDVAAHVSRAPYDEDDMVPEDEQEELELDVSEALNSNLIRRLALWEQEHGSIADQEVATTTPASSSSTVTEEVYSFPTRSFKYQFKWLSCADRPLRLQKVTPDGVLEELRRLTGCDFKKEINKGILYVGSDDENCLNVAKQKLTNLVKNRKKFFCVNHLFYSEGHEKVRFTLIPFSKVKKFYFATTILDNLHVIFNGGLDCKAGELPSDWQTLADAVTTRCAHWDQKNGVFDLLKKVDISVISDSSTDVNFKEWVNFKYSAKGEESDDPRRHYSSQPTTERYPRQLVPSASQSRTQGSNPTSSAQAWNSLARLQNGVACQQLAPPGTALQVNGNTQKTLRIERWAAGVNLNEVVAPTSTNGESHVKKVKPAWDTYEEHNLNQIVRTKKEKPAQASSVLYSNISAMKRSTSTGFAPTGKRAEPPETRETSQMPRSVSQLLGLFPATNTQTPYESSTSVHSTLANVTNTSLVDLGMPLSTKEGRPVNPQFSESFLENFKSHTLLDDDISMVVLPVLEPARQGESNTSWTPMQPVKHQSAVADIDELLISFSPPLQSAISTSDDKLLPELMLPEPGNEAGRGTTIEAWDNTKLEEKDKQHDGKECRHGPSALSKAQVTRSQTPSQSILDQIAQDTLLAAKLQREEQEGSDPRVDALLVAQYQREVDPPHPVSDAELAVQWQIEEEQSINFNQGATSIGRLNIEKVQEDDEVASRIYHRTMNQKAGRGKYHAKQPHYQKGVRRLPVPDPIRAPAPAPAKNDQGSEDPVSEFVAGVTENFSSFMTAIRPFRGQIVLQVEFGRIIMRDFAPSNYFHKSGDKMFKDYDLRNLLLKPTEEGPFCSFTKVLTLLPADMQYLVKIKDKKENPLWHPTSIWNVTYEFHFRDTNAFDSLFFLVEVDGETFKTEVKVLRELGNIYCHGTMRHWDFRIAATGHESSRDVKEKYGAVRAAVENTLYIPPGMKTPLLLWEMETALSNRFQIQELQVKRVLKYQSEDRRSILNVTEIQSLDIQGGEVPGKPISIFQGAPGPIDEAPTKKLRQWWEASISSADADEVLEENKSLELGDEPGWTHETLSNMHVASALYLPACEMLKKMDGVGFLNRNGIERAVVEASNVVPKEKKNKAVDQADFW